MRLWHYKLIPVLPKEMLVSQWRECIAIRKQWEKGSLKHRLVNYVMNYDKGLFNYYARLIVDELVRRKIKLKIAYYVEIDKFCNNEIIKEYYPEHNQRYLDQCYYNLQEKYDRGIIKNDEWSIIDKLYKNGGE